MADYAPKFLYADQITSTASATITGGQVLVVSGNGTVGPAGDAADITVVGVAAMDAASNAKVSYFPRGKVHVTTTAGAVVAGAGVSAGAAGTVDDDGGSDPILGVFLTTAGSGEKAEWMEF
ncbi:hypothetical protein [Plantactinospora sp. WMMB782]|uniref:hypothetical protein n=1 Tax=Plantactinospora sp. WMMB782 TaxID=3404121 RepID=UPI003B93418C